MENRFWIFDTTGKYLRSWGTAGSGPGQIDLMDQIGGDGYGGIAFDPDGSFYVLDTGNNRVEKFDPQDNFLNSFGGFGIGDGQFALPTSIASDEHGHVYVADNRRNDIQVFTSAGSFIRSVGKGLAGESPFYSWVAVDAAGNIYTNSYSQVIVYAPDGSLKARYDLSAIMSDPVAIAVDPAGHIYVVGDGGSTPEEYPAATIELDTDGTVLHSWPGTGESISLDPSSQTMYAAFYHWPYMRAYALPQG
jgi:sugar lactone lactonase YvrE